MEQRRRRTANVESSSNNTKARSTKTENKGWTKNLFFKIVAVIFVVITCIFFGYIIKFDMLPGTYLAVMGVALAILTGLCVWGLVKRKGGITLRIVITVFLIFVMAVYIFGINYMDATMEFMDVMTTEVEETEDYYVVTLKVSKYDTLESLKGKNVHTFMAGEDYNDVKEGILAKSKVNFKEDESLEQLVTTLLNDEIYAVLISNSQYNMLSEDYVEFKDKTRIIYTVTHKIKLTEEPKEEVEEEENKKSYNIEDGVFNIYISGIDTAGRISNVARSDANIIVTVNTNTHKILLTSIPRDYYVKLHSKGKKDKLTHSGVYGIKETYTTVEDLLDIDINYYVRVNFTTLEKVVDALGGVDVYSDYAFTSYNYSYKKGKNHLNGKEALEFSRERMSFASGDRQRIKNQQAVIEAIMNKVLTSETILTKYTSLLSSLSNSFQTNIKTSEINSIVKGQLNNMTGWTIESISLDGTGAKKTTYSYGSQPLYVMIPNETTVINATNKINSILEGK